MKLLLAALLSATAISGAAKGSTYYIDLTDVAPVFGISGPCYCGSGPVFPVYSAQPGDVFDFGSVTPYTRHSWVT